MKTLPFLLLGASLALGSCATGTKQRAGDVSDGTSLPDSVAEEPADPAISAGGSPVVLVLGPGMARGLAHAGVLKGLDNAGVKVGAILGTEIGALIGSLYATRSTINEFEWSLLKLKSEIFARQSGSLSALQIGRAHV